MRGGGVPQSPTPGPSGVNKTHLQPQDYDKIRASSPKPNALMDTSSCFPGFNETSEEFTTSQSRSDSSVESIKGESDARQISSDDLLEGDSKTALDEEEEEEIPAVVIDVDDMAASRSSEIIVENDFPIQKEPNHTGNASNDNTVDSLPAVNHSEIMKEGILNDKAEEDLKTDSEAQKTQNGSLFSTQEAPSNTPEHLSMESEVKVGEVESSALEAARKTAGDGMTSPLLAKNNLDESATGSLLADASGNASSEKDESSDHQNQMSTGSEVEKGESLSGNVSYFDANEASSKFSDTRDVFPAIVEHSSTDGEVSCSRQDKVSAMQSSELTDNEVGFAESSSKESAIEGVSSGNVEELTHPHEVSPVVVSTEPSTLRTPVEINVVDETSSSRLGDIVPSDSSSPHEHFYVEGDLSTQNEFKYTGNTSSANVADVYASSELDESSHLVSTGLNIECSSESGRTHKEGDIHPDTSVSKAAESNSFMGRDNSGVDAFLGSYCQASQQTSTHVGDDDSPSCHS